MRTGPSIPTVLACLAFILWTGPACGGRGPSVPLGSISGPLFTFQSFGLMHWLGMAITFAAILLFRHAACRYRFSRQIPWVLAALASGCIGLYLPRGLTFLNIVLVCVVLFLYTAVAEARGRAPRFAQTPIYYGGLGYLLVLNSFVVRCEDVGVALCVVFFLAVYLIVKLVTRSYEYNSPPTVLNTVPRKAPDTWPPGSNDDSLNR